MTFKKNDFIEIFKDEGFSEEKSRFIVNTFLDTLKYALKTGMDVNISGIGTFSCVEKPAKTVKFQKREYHVPERKSVKFRTSKTFNDYLNGKN